MNKEKAYSSGSVKEMIVIAFPMAVSFACDAVMIFTDRLFMAKLGPSMMNAVMAGGLSAFLTISFFMGLTGYATALVAQYLGAGRKAMCSIVLTQALIVTALGYPVILLCRPLMHWFFSVMNVPAEQMAAQIEYYDIILYGAIFGISRTALGGFFSGIGRTRIVMVASLTAMIVNVGASYVLIFGKFSFPALGLKGAAIGSIIGMASAVFILLWEYLSPQIRNEFDVLKSFLFHKTVMKKLIHFGYPQGLEMLLNMIAFDTVVLTFHSQGLLVATASTIMFNWDLVSFIPLMGAEIGVTSLVGRYMGAGKPEIAERSTISGVKFGFLYSACIFVIFLGFPNMLVSMFKPDVDASLFVGAEPLAVFMIRWAAVYVPVQAVFIAFIGALRGAGDTFWAMCFSVAVHWVMALSAQVILNYWGLSPKIAWISLIFIFLACSLVVFGRYKKGAWKQIKVVDSEAVL